MPPPRPHPHPHPRPSALSMDVTVATDLALLSVSGVLLHVALGTIGLALVCLAALAMQHAALASRSLRAVLSRCARVSPHASRMAKSPPKSMTDAGSYMDDDNGLLSTVTSEDSVPESEDGAREEERRRASPLSSFDSLELDPLARLVIRDLGSSMPRAVDTASPSDQAQDQASPLSGPASASPPSFSSSSARPLLQINAREPMRFENELFVGHVHFFVRTTPEDPQWAHLFQGKRRMFWVQVQGRFKRAPRGTVYIGGELPAAISMGIFTKSIALVILRVVQQLMRLVNYSLGDVQNKVLPGVSFPLFQSADQLVVTPENETPPPLGSVDFGESELARRLRRLTPAGTEKFLVGPTYSFDFHTMYVDLTQWKTANIPGMSDMSLTTFLDENPLRLVAYEIVAAPTEPHPQDKKRYAFCFDVRFEHQPQSSRSYRSESDFSVDSDASRSTGMTTTTYDSSPCSTVVSDDTALATEDLATIDARNAQALIKWDVNYLFWIEEAESATNSRRVHYVFRIIDRAEGMATSRIVMASAHALRLLLVGKHRHLKALRELQNLRFQARSKMDSYSVITEEAMNVEKELQAVLDSCSMAWDVSVSPRRTAFASALYQWFTARTQLQPPEQLSHESETAETTTAMAPLTPMQLGVHLNKRERDSLGVRFEGVAYRFYADMLLRQEVLVLSNKSLIFYRSYCAIPEKEISLDRIISVQAIAMPYADPAESLGEPFAHTFKISTFGEEIVLCVATEHARNTWIRVILQECSPQENFERSLTDPLMVCYTPSVPLRPSGRVILNSRALFPLRTVQDPLVIVSNALESALAIHRLGDTADVTTILEFLNRASAVRTVDLELLHGRPHEERLAFFLNLYHVVLAHAMISSRYPSSKAQWQTFQASMCYAVGQDCGHAVSMSLVEIEHVILRARLPSAEVPHLDLERIDYFNAGRLARIGLAHPDFRVSFALAMNQVLPIGDVTLFEPMQVHDQLNAIVKRAVADHVRIDEPRKTIYLPAICEWYRRDYGSSGSPLHCVRKLLGYMAPEIQDQVLRILDCPVVIHIKYDAFPYAAKTMLTKLTPRAQAPTESTE